MRLSQQLDPRLAIRHCELNVPKLDSAENKLLQDASAHKQTMLNRLKSLAQRLQRFHPENQIKLYQQAIEQQQNRLLCAIKNRQRNERQRLNDVQKRLENNSIQASLNRGYAMFAHPKSRCSNVQAALRKKIPYRFNLQMVASKPRSINERHLSLKARWSAIFL